MIKIQIGLSISSVVFLDLLEKLIVAQLVNKLPACN